MKVSQNSWHYRIYARSGHANTPVGRLGYCAVIFGALVLAAGGLSFFAIGVAFILQSIAFWTGLVESEASGAATFLLMVGIGLCASGLAVSNTATGILDRLVSWVKQRFAANPIVVTK